MRRVRYCLALLATIIGCESLPGMKVDNPVVGPPPPRVSAPASDEQSEPAQTEPEGPQAGDKVAEKAVIERVSAATAATVEVAKFPLDPEYPESMLVATVNSLPITVGDVLEPYKNFIETKVYPNIPPEQHGEVRKNWVLRFLPDVIDRKLRVSGLLSGLNDKQLKALNEYLEKSWVDYKTDLCAKMNISSVELEDRMKQDGADLERVKQNWREGSIAHQFVLLKVKGKSTYEPTRQDLIDYYDEHQDEFAFTGRVKWQQIVVRRQKGETREEAEARALELMEQLNSGAAFSEVASKHSEGATRAKGGYWDWTESGSLACKDEEDFLFSADIGTTSDLIAYRDEFHIAQVLDRVEAGHRSFEQVQTQNEIRAALKAADEERLKRAAVEEFMKTDVIETVFGDEWKFKHPQLEAARKESRTRS